ncbi:PEGA domain-containing protein [Candidatus Woesebacteria bacterium]|nr:MAG: PEGA domain-containing protein [Candidatus Woesebacteria bacterium]
MTKIRVLIFLLTIVVVGSLGTIISLYAKGYRFDVKTFRFEPNGLLVIKSDPDGAQVFINTELKTATNATIPLPPDTYDVEIRKEGYLSWKKRLVIEKEIVTEANASLFKAVPSLSAVTFSGNINPVPTNDLTKIAYAVPKTGLWVIETVNLPLGFAKDPRQITDGDLTGASWEWSPNGREILLTTKTGIFLLDAGRFTPQNQRVNITSGKTEILAEWEKERKIKLAAQIKNLPEELVDILERKTDLITFSPDKTKILYTASSSAELADNLIKPLPGASTQKQERHIKAGKIYVYDIKEDRNFSISNIAATLRWFPTSQHLVLAEDGKITIMDYDGTNRQEVYSGSYIAPHAFPTVNRERLLILTNLGADSVLPNLYSLSLK